MNTSSLKTSKYLVKFSFTEKIINLTMCTERIGKVTCESMQGLLNDLRVEEHKKYALLSLQHRVIY